MRLHLTAISLLLLAGGANAEESYSAKSLFFGEDDSVVAVSTTQKDSVPAAAASKQDDAKKPAVQVAQKKNNPSKSVGLSYFIRLQNPDGSTRDVLTSRKFKSGERFQLGLKVNRPSYIYVLNEGPGGKVVQIYPQPGVDNFINAMGTVFLPGKGAFEFDNEPGTEHLLVYISSTPMTHGMTDRVKKMRPDVITASVVPAITGASCVQPVITQMMSAPNENLQIASAETYASKGIGFTEDAPCAQETPKPETYASKGIAFSDDSDAGGLQSASYVVKKTTTPDASLFLKIKLNHQ
jgi:Domain of unknown function (DUF4384)